jgi:glycosyltransferase involved in cell wall biosynthesis
MSDSKRKEHILVIRSSPLPLFKNQLAWLIENSGLPIIAAVQTGVEEELRKEFAKVRYILLKEGPISIGSIDLKSFLSKERLIIKRVVVPTAQMTSYDNVLMEAVRLAGTRVYTCGEDNSIQRLKTGSMLKLWFNRYLLKITKSLMPSSFKPVYCGSVKKNGVIIAGVDTAPVPPVEDGPIPRMTYFAAEESRFDDICVVSPWHPRAYRLAGESRQAYVFLRSSLRYKLLQPLLKFCNPLEEAAYYRNCYQAGLHKIISNLKPELAVIHNRPWMASPVRKAGPETKILLFMNNFWFKDLNTEQLEELFGMIHGVITISNRLSERIKQLPGADSLQFRTCWNGIDPDEFNPDKKKSPEALVYRRKFETEPDSETKIILYAARIIPDKGLDLLLDAFEVVLQHFPSARLLIAGNESFGSQSVITEYERRMNRRVNSMGEKALFSGYVPYDSMPYFMAAGDCYVLPSIFDEEGLPSSIIEAMSTEVPTIGSYAGGIPEAIDDTKNGLLVDPKNSDALAEAIISILNDDVAAENMANAGRKTVLKHFTEKAHSRKFDQIVESFRNGQGLNPKPPGAR